jgi:hypothetical protein
VIIINSFLTITLGGGPPPPPLDDESQSILAIIDDNYEIASKFDSESTEPPQIETQVYFSMQLENINTNILSYQMPLLRV